MSCVPSLAGGSVSASLAMTMLAALQIARAQNHTERLPRFEDYPVKEVFNRIPHLPILVTPEQRLFRTRIREGVEKGWGVWINGAWGEERNLPGPNFAGHYIVIVWGCGTACIRMAVSNAETGAVYDPPVSYKGFALPMLVFPNSVGRAADVEFRKDSRLMIVRATPHADRRSASPFAFYSLWQDEHWTLLRRVHIEE